MLAMSPIFVGYAWSQTAADTALPADASNTNAENPIPAVAPQKSMVIDTLEIKDMDINDVLKLLSSKSGLNIIAGKSISGRVTIFLQNVNVFDALTIILKSNDLAFMESRGVVQIITGSEYEQITGHKFGVNTESTIVSLQSAKASDVVVVLNQVKSQAGKVIADDQSNSIIIQDVPEKIEELLNFIKTIDAPAELKVYNLEHISGEGLVSKLQEMISPKIGNVKFDSFSNKLFVRDVPKKLTEISKYISQVDVPRKTKEFDINYAKAEDLAKTIGPMLTKDVGSIEYDARSNTLVVTDIPPRIDEISNMITALDKKDKEVFIEAKIIQIALNDEYQMGVDWHKLILKAGNTGVNFTSNFSIPNPGANIGQAAIGTLNNDSFNDIIQALDSFGKSRTLSSPRLAVINNQEASILIGTTTPYTTSTSVANAATATTSESVSFIDTGVKLHVTPIIHDDGFITMKIKPEISNQEAKPYSVPGGGTIPIVDTSEVQTTVRVKDGVTIIIGGLMKNELINNKNKVPVLGDLPIIGKAFSNEDRVMQKTEIVIFLTPHIINGDVYNDPEKYLKTTSSLKPVKTYYDPLPKDESTTPVP